MEAAASAPSARKSRSKSLPRRTPDFVRPYLSKTEIEVVLEALEGDLDKLLDPSLASAVVELKRWVR